MVAEQNTVCRSTGQRRQDSFDGGKEAHVEHPVRFIQNQTM